MLVLFTGGTPVNWSRFSRADSLSCMPATIDRRCHKKDAISQGAISEDWRLFLSPLIGIGQENPSPMGASGVQQPLFTASLAGDEAGKDQSAIPTRS